MYQGCFYCAVLLTLRSIVENVCIVLNVRMCIVLACATVHFSEWTVQYSPISSLAIEFHDGIIVNIVRRRDAGRFLPQNNVRDNKKITNNKHKDIDHHVTL